MRRPDRYQLAGFLGALGLVVLLLAAPALWRSIRPSEEERLRRQVTEWAAALENRDVEAVLDALHADYAGPVGGDSLADARDTVRRELPDFQRIDIDFEEISVALDPDGKRAEIWLRFRVAGIWGGSKIYRAVPFRGLRGNAEAGTVDEGRLQLRRGGPEDAWRIEGLELPALRR